MRRTILPVDGADTGDAVIVTHSLCQEPVPDLPGKHGGVLAFVICDLVDHFGSSNLWFGSPDYPGADTACFIVPAKQSTKDVWICPQKHRNKISVFLKEMLKIFISVFLVSRMFCFTLDSWVHEISTLMFFKLPVKGGMNTSWRKVKSVHLSQLWVSCHFNLISLLVQQVVFNLFASKTPKLAQIRPQEPQL